MKMKALSVSILVSASALAACSPFDPDLGPAPYICGDVEPRCPSGYTCQAADDPSDPNAKDTCVNGDTIPDGGNTGFQCLEDTFGQNDTKEGAFVTPVAGQNQMFAALTSLCPAADQDHYQINVTTQSAIRVSTSWESGNPVSVSILNAGGTSIGNATLKGDNENCVCLKDLPTGLYFAKVFAGAQVQNNYRVEIKVITSAECTAQPVCN
jgi:hypothetical protein